VLDIVVHKNIRLSHVTVSDILDSDHLPIVFHVLDHFRTKKTLGTTRKFTDYELFRSLASNLVSPRIQIKSEVDADKSMSDFTASTALAYRLSTSKITFSELNNDLPGLDQLLKYNKMLRKLWQETRDPTCKAAVKRISESITAPDRAPVK
jgi:hypothetical protein